MFRVAEVRGCIISCIPTETLSGEDTLGYEPHGSHLSGEKLIPMCTMRLYRTAIHRSICVVILCEGTMGP